VFDIVALDLTFLVDIGFDISQLHKLANWVLVFLFVFYLMCNLVWLNLC